MSIENELEQANETISALRVTVNVLADVVDDMARERHERLGHVDAYRECTEDVCSKARRALKEAP